MRLHWPEIAGYLAPSLAPGSYKTAGVDGLRDAMDAYALFNPHATFTLDTGSGPTVWPATDPGWKKWLPSAPTSPHWYDTDQLRGLIAAYLAKDRQTGRVRTVRELVAEFSGLSGSAKQKAIAEEVGLGRARLDDLIDGGDVALAKVEALLGAMRRASRPIKPAALGVLGEAHLTERLVASYGVARESIKYKKVLDEERGRPLVLEVAFGVLTEDYAGCGRSIVAGINWAPALELPFQRMPFLLGQQRADPHDPITVIAHLAKPGVTFTDRGKGRADV